MKRLLTMVLLVSAFYMPALAQKAVKGGGQRVVLTSHLQIPTQRDGWLLGC